MTFQSNNCVGGGNGNLDFKFLNFCKGSARFINPNAASVTNWYDDTMINDDGYPIQSGNGGLTFQIAFIPGTYVVKWQGQGKATCSAWGSQTNSSMGIWTGGGAGGATVTNGRFTCVVSSLSFTIVSIDGPSISNLEICLLSEESLLDAGGIFRPSYLSQMSGYNGILRMGLGPGNINNNASCLWADRANVSQLTYNARFLHGHKCGATTGGPTTYTLNSFQNFPNFPNTPTHGTVIHFNVPSGQFNTSVNGNTLNVGSWGAISWDSGYLDGFPVNSVQNAQTAIYDGTLNKWISWFGTGSQGANFFCANGHPYEIMIEECNQTGCPGWFNIPFYADDNHVTQLATLLCTYPYKQSAVYFEYHNEVWNTAFGFPASTIATQWGASVLGIPALAGNFQAQSGWYGYRFRLIAALIRSVFNSYGVGNKVKMIFAFQGANADSTTDISQSTPLGTRMQNNTYAALSGPAAPYTPPNFGPNAPIVSADVIAYAHYFGSNTLSETDAVWDRNVIQNSPRLRTQVDQYLAGNYNAAFNGQRDDFISGLGPSGVFGYTRYANWANIAGQISKPIQLYEQNWEIQPPSTGYCSSAYMTLYANTNQRITTNSNALTAISWSGGVVTATTTSAHNVAVGQRITIGGVTPSGYNGFFIAQTGTTGSTLVYNLASNPGTATVNGNYLPANSGMDALGLFQFTSSTANGGDTLTSAGLYSWMRLNKAGNAITGSTLLSGAAATDSILNDFIAGGAITVNSQTITFVASGASGNNQVNVTDSIATLLAKIDIATGTSTPSLVNSAPFDSSYGGTTGKIGQFQFAFYASTQASQAWHFIMNQFRTLSNLYGGGSISGMPGSYPWASFTPDTSVTGISGNYVPDANNAALGNFNALMLDNNGKRRFQLA